VLRSKLDSLSLAVDGDYYALTLLEHGVRVDYMVNTDNWRIEKVVGSLTINGAVFQFLTEYSNFTFRDGVLLHERENKFAGGVNTAVLQLRRLSLGARLPDTRFMPSDEIPTEVKQEQSDII